MKIITNITYLTLMLVALACFAFSPQAGAVCQEGCLANQNTVLGDDALSSNTTGIENTATVDPPLDGGCPNFNTAEGEDALFSLTTGHSNTAIGHHALFNNSTGSLNTAIGDNALYSNVFGFNGNTAIGTNALGSIGGNTLAKLTSQARGVAQ